MEESVGLNMLETTFGKDGPFTVKWRCLSYEVTPSLASNMAAKFCGGEDPQPRTILDSLNGHFSSGQLTALMGPSGSGKSTLLECLIGIRSRGKTGNVLLSRSEELSVAFIPQQDHFQNLLTVRESLYFASRLQNNDRDKWKEKSQHVAKVDQLIRKLGLQDCADTRITRCSGGQLKRLSVGQELVSEPAILILDEPTSGLDASSCHSIVKFLHSLTKEEGLTIVASIHQPSAKVFNLFDKVYALSKIGKCIYEGDPKDLVDYFAGFELYVPQYYNPADYLIELASGDYGMEAICKTARLKDLADKLVYDDNDGNTFEDMIVVPKFPFFRHLDLLTRRAMLCQMREPLVFMARLSCHFVVPFLIGLMYHGANIGTSDACPSALDSFQDIEKLTTIREKYNEEMVAVQNNIGSWFFAIIFVQFGGLLPTVLSVQLGMNAFAKERNNGWYGVNTYFIASILADIPLQVICPVVYISLTWYLTEQIFEYDRIAIVMVTYILLALVSQSQGVLVGAIFMKSAVTAVFMAPITCIPMLLFSGFFVRIENISTYLKPLTMVSYDRYAFENSMAAIYGFDRCGVDSMNVIETTREKMAAFMRIILSQAFNGGQDSFVDDSGFSIDTSNVANITHSLVNGIAGQLGGKTELVDGKLVIGVLGSLKLSEDVIIPNMIAMVACFFVLRALTYLTIFYKGTNKRS